MARVKAARLVLCGPLMMFEVKDCNGEHHYVFSRPEYADTEQESHWLTAAVCCVDNNKVLVEFDDTRNGISRLWVSKADVDYGNTHAFTFPKETGFPVVKVDLNNGCTAWDEKVRVVLIEKTAEAAQREADRLNRLNGSSRVIYFWQAALTVTG